MTLVSVCRRCLVLVLWALSVCRWLACEYDSWSRGWRVVRGCSLDAQPVVVIAQSVGSLHTVRWQLRSGAVLRAVQQHIYI